MTNSEFDRDDFESGSSFEKRSKKSANPRMANGKAFGRRRGKAPQQFNGIHRRRKKKIRW